MINSLGSETINQQRQSLSQLSGGLYGGTQTIGLQVGEQFLQRVTTRMISNGTFLSGPVSSESANDDDEEEEARGQIGADSTRGWVQGFGVGGSLRSDGNASGIRYGQGGALYGMDLGSDETGVMGIAGSSSYVGFHDGIGAGGQLTAYQLGLYAIKHDDVAYILGTANYGYDDYSSNRNVLIGGVNNTLRGNFAGHQLGAYAESGLKIHAGWFHLQPLAGLQYVYLSQQGFGESGGPAALNVSGSQADSLRTSLGGRLIVDQLVGPWGAVWSPYWHARWVSELLNNDRVVNASFNGAPVGGAFNTHGTQLGQNYMVYGKGVQVQLDDSWSMFANVDLMFGDHFQAETGSLGMIYAW